MMDLQAILLQSFLAENKNVELLLHAFSGVKPERLVQGLSPRYCALSLVVEPNMYPEINVLIVDLHRRHISTFLVSNAQFPDKIKTLKPINHLYVSVDAATKETLKTVDRLLFSEFRERFLDSLKSLHHKDQ
ncbi:Os10g0365900 [Oryza sativa Japonica Group]|uniref:Os10g0365900 protein n=1 Tax=Oryza sativa subsp. japonica TaxID=39947 RepID=A0A0P0XTB0_ORYSJ|nr:Os10g0365900 [Oryza sativa Japonica Group]